MVLLYYSCNLTPYSVVLCHFSLFIKPVVLLVSKINKLYSEPLCDCSDSCQVCVVYLWVQIPQGEGQFWGFPVH